MTKKTHFLCTKDRRIWKDLCQLRQYKLSLWSCRRCHWSRV